MVKKCSLLFALSVLLLMACGCETITGTVKGAADGASGGIKKDWAAAKKADEWMRKNLW